MIRTTPRCLAYVQALGNPTHIRFQSTLTSPIEKLSTIKNQLISPSAVPYLVSTPPPIAKSPEQARLRRSILKRPGLIGIKRGMTAFFDNQGTRVPCTMIEIDQNEVISTKTLDKNGYYAVQIGCGYKPKHQSKAMLGHYAKAEVSPKAKIIEFEVLDESGLLPLGTQLKADHFKVGQLIDVQSNCKGKGFAGVMKRHGFHGLAASHGVSLAHRSAGSTGQNTSPARVLPGKKMAGRMGGNLHTIEGLKVLDFNAEKGYILVKGAVSGSKGSFVRLRDSVRKEGVVLNQVIKKQKLKESQMN